MMQNQLNSAAQIKNIGPCGPICDLYETLKTNPRKRTHALVFTHESKNLNFKANCKKIPYNNKLFPKNSQLYHKISDNSSNLCLDKAVEFLPLGIFYNMGPSKNQVFNYIDLSPDAYFGDVNVNN